MTGENGYQTKLKLEIQSFIGKAKEKKVRTRKRGQWYEKKVFNGKLFFSFSPSELPKRHCRGCVRTKPCFLAWICNFMKNVDE